MKKDETSINRNDRGKFEMHILYQAMLLSSYHCILHITANVAEIVNNNSYNITKSCHTKFR